MFIKKNVALIACLFSFISTQFISLKAMDFSTKKHLFDEKITKFCNNHFGFNNFKVVGEYETGSSSSKILQISSDNGKNFILKFLDKNDAQSLTNEKLACERLKNTNYKYVCPPLECITLENELPCIVYNFADTMSYELLAKYVKYSNYENPEDIDTKTLKSRSNEDIIKIFKKLLNSKIETIIHLLENKKILYFDSHSGNWQLIYKKSIDGKNDTIEPTLIDFGELVDTSKMDQNSMPTAPWYNRKLNPATNKALVSLLYSLKDDWENIVPKESQSLLCINTKLDRIISHYNFEITKFIRGVPLPKQYAYPLTLGKFLEILKSLPHWLFPEISLKSGDEMEQQALNYIVSFLNKMDENK